MATPANLPVGATAIADRATGNELKPNADGSINIGSGGGGGTQYTDGQTPPTNPIGSVPIFDKAGVWTDVGTDNPMPVQAPSGAFVDMGAKADSAATDNTSSWSVVALLKGIFGKLLGSIAVTGTFWQTTQPVSGTVTSNIGTTNGLALDATLTGGTAKTIPQVAGANVGTTNPMPTDAAAQQGPVNITNAGGASGGTSPNFTGTCTASADNSVTFASKVRTVQMHNQSSVNVPYEHDITAAATSPYLSPGQLVYIDVHTTTIHVFPSNALPINAASGLIVRGWN